MPGIGAQLFFSRLSCTLIPGSDAGLQPQIGTGEAGRTVWNDSLAHHSPQETEVEPDESTQVRGGSKEELPKRGVLTIEALTLKPEAG